MGLIYTGIILVHWVLIHYSFKFLQNPIKKVSIMIFKMIFFAFPMKYIFQNYFIFLATMVFEISRKEEGRRELMADETKSIILGLVILVIVSVGLFVILTIGLVRLHKWRRNSFFAFVFDGLNRTSRLQIIIYYTHFFLIRILIIMFLGISPSGSSNGIWMALANLQVLFIILNIRKIYPQLQHNTINVLTEILILIVICFCTSASIGNEKTLLIKFKLAMGFTIVYFAYNMMILVVGLGFLIGKIVALIRKKIQQRKL
jgi:hypothetical protein